MKEPTYNDCKQLVLASALEQNSTVTEAQQSSISHKAVVAEVAAEPGFQKLSSSTYRSRSGWRFSTLCTNASSNTTSSPSRQLCVSWPTKSRQPSGTSRRWLTAHLGAPRPVRRQPDVAVARVWHQRRVRRQLEDAHLTRHPPDLLSADGVRDRGLRAGHEESAVGRGQRQTRPDDRRWSQRHVSCRRKAGGREEKSEFDRREQIESER